MNPDKKSLPRLHKMKPAVEDAVYRLNSAVVRGEPTMVLEQLREELRKARKS